MTDQLADPTSGTAAPDIETIKAQLSAELKAEYDERIKGFQRLLAGRDETQRVLEAQLEEFKTAGLSEEERQNLQEQRLAKENQELRAQLELAQLASEYTDEMPVFQELLSAKTAKEQLELMRRIRTAQAKAPAPATPAQSQEPELEIPDIDRNNPMRSFGDTIVLPDGRAMNEQLADQILSRAPRLGSLR